MSEQPLEIDDRKEPSEGLVEVAKQIGAEATKLDDRKTELDSKSTAEKVLNPAYWIEKAWWKKGESSHQERMQQFANLVAEHIGEIQLEAEFYVAAYDDYMRMQQELSAALGVEPVVQDMNDFIRDMDSTPNRVSYRDLNDDISRSAQSHLPKGKYLQLSDKEMERKYRYYGRRIAVEDILAPHIPVKKDENGEKYSAAPFDENIKINPTAARFPRLDLFYDGPDALTKLDQKDYARVLEMEISTNATGERATHIKYLPLNEQAASLLSDHKNIEETFWWAQTDEGYNFYNIRTRMLITDQFRAYQNGESYENKYDGSDKLPLPWYRQADEAQQPMSGKVHYEYFDPRAGEVVTGSRDFDGDDDDDARRNAIFQGGRGQQVGETHAVDLYGISHIVPKYADTKPAKVVLEDGTEVPFDEFIVPVVRQERSHK